MRENKLAVAIFTSLLLLLIAGILFFLNNNKSSEGNVLGESEISLKVTSIIDGLKYNEDGTVNIKYIYTIKNPYDGKVTNLKATSNLKGSFGKFPYKILNLSSDNLSVNKDFNGDNSLDLLTNASTLSAQTTSKVYLEVQLDPLGTNGPFNNSVKAEGELSGPSTSNKGNNANANGSTTSTKNNTSTTPKDNTSKTPTGSTSGTNNTNTGSTPKPAPTTKPGVGSGGNSGSTGTSTTKPKPTNTGSTSGTSTSTNKPPKKTETSSASGKNDQNSTSNQSGSKSKPLVLGLASVSFTLQSASTDIGAAGFVLSSTTSSSSSENLTDTNFEINPVTLLSIVGAGVSIFSFKKLNRISAKSY